MSVFGTIRDRIITQQQQQQAQQAQPQGGGAASVMAGLDVGAALAAQQVDVEQVLEGISRDKGNPDLNWRTSIVDLMKLLDLDSSLQNRAELAQELGYTGERNGSAEMNIWLHRRVMEELEKNGGKVSDALNS